MCGIAGVVGASEGGRDAEAMAATLRHRGPDASGLWSDQEHEVALAFRRLAIIDLTETGNQPMTSRDGRVVLVFNGEIYNYEQLRDRLAAEGVRFRGTSDTEVLVEAIATWGIDATLRAANGMFALAAWDRSERVLHLARDRFGEKPLYYGRIGAVFVFGSELKALRANPRVTLDVDRGAVGLFLRHGYVPVPWTIYTGISKLPPACRVEVRQGQAGEPLPYWGLAENQTDVLSGPVEAEDVLDELLRESVRMRMVADVPLGALLSGGIDSSLVVALMQAQSASRVRTFTIGFGEGGYDEAPAARAVACHLGTDHTELQVTADDALAVVPRLAEIYDEPFADSSQIPTYLVCELARRHVTVALTGDGADEMFGGYSRYRAAQGLIARLGSLPAPARRAAAAAFDSVPERALRPLERRVSRPNEKLAKLSRSLRAAGGAPSQLNWVWQDPPVVGEAIPEVGIRTPPGLRPPERMMFEDALTYLPDDILVKVDRAAMAVSLEGRMPFLDPHVADFAWSLPLEWRLRGGEGKWLLRRVLRRYVPDPLVARPKTGFGVPIGAWLRGQLREWASDLLERDQPATSGLLDMAVVRAAWRDHLGGTDRSHELWAVLMLQAWAGAAAKP